MSVFRGSIAEYPGIVVDHFIPVNCERGRVFFLSHCHKDHMTGLGSPALLDALRRRGSSLHCSEVTRALLLHYTEFRDLVPFLKALPMEEPVSMTLELSSDTLVQVAVSFVVTLLPAGHCPGSTMFLFEGSSGTALYTGDFRLTVDETKRIQSLHPGGKLLDIATLYLDTTFCCPAASDIPDRETSRQYILSFATAWLAQSPQNAVLLQCSMFGYEHIFMAISQKLCTKIHVGSWRYSVYSEIPAVQECLTTDGQSTRVHCCNYQGAAAHLWASLWLKGSQWTPLQCVDYQTFNAMVPWFGKMDWLLAFSLPEQNMYRVMHSMHPSFSEICAFAAYLRPRGIVPCVVPAGDTALTDVHARLKVFLSGSAVQPSLSAVSNQETVMGVACREEEEDECSSESDPEWQGGGDLSDGDGVKENELSKKFIATPLAPPPVLPSMLIDDEGYSLSSAPGSEPVSTSGGTVGSLEQTPIDLYLSDGSSPSSQEAGNEVAGIAGLKAEEDTSKPDKPDNPVGGPGFILDACSSDNFGKVFVKPDTTLTGPQTSLGDLVQSTNGTREHPVLVLSAEDEVVTLLERTQHRRHSSVEGSGEDLEPHPKRSRRSLPGISGAQDSSSPLHPSLTHVTRTVFIDLTKDDGDNDDDDVSSRSNREEPVVLRNSSLTKGDGDDGDVSSRSNGEKPIVLHNSSLTGAQLDSACVKEDVLSDSGLQQSPDSPGYLPPTPGRERVGSILKRRAIGF